MYPKFGVKALLETITAFLISEHNPYSSIGFSKSLLNL